MDNKITEVLAIEGDHSGAVSSLKATSREMQSTEKTASSFGARVANVGNGILGWLDKMAAGAAKMGGIFTGGFALGAKGMGLLGSASGILTGALFGVNKVAALAASTLGAFIGHGLRIAGMSDQAARLGKTWERTLNQMSAPLVHAFAQGMDLLNQTLQNPAVQHFLGFLTGIAAAILNAVLPALRAAAAGVIAFLTALQGGDFAGAFGKAWDAAGAELGRKSRAGGVATGATFMQGFNEGVRKNPPEPPKLQALPGGFLKDIGDLGTKALNAFLAGFRKPDLDALNATGDAIRTRLDTLYKNAKLPALKIAPQLVIDQTAVARALSDAQKPGADLEGIISMLREQLSHLGPNVQDFVENQLRAVSATRELEAATKAVTGATNNLTAAQAALVAKEGELKSIQAELTEARRRQAREAEKLLPLSDEIRNIEQEIAQKLIDQAPERAHLVDLAEEQEDVEREIARLEGEQAQKLKELEPLRQRVTEATEAHRQAELALRDAQDAMIPIQERLNQAREDMAAFTAEATRREGELKSALDAEADSQRQLQAEISERERLTQEGIQNEERALADRIGQQEELLKQVDATHAAELNGYKSTIALVDEKYRKEIEGANKALAIANNALAAEESRNRVALLRFARQRQEAQGITDVNQRIQALAKINRAEELYTASVKDRLDASRLEAKLQEDNLQAVQDRVDAEKGDIPERLKALEEAIRLEKQPIEERIAAIKTEGEERLKQLRRAAEDQKRSDDALLRAGAERVAQAQAAYDTEVATNNTARQAIQDRIDAATADEKAQQKAIDRLARDEVVAARRVETAQFELDTAEKRVHIETDGAIATTRERATSLAAERELLEDRLDDDLRSARDRLAAAQSEHALRLSKLQEEADLENRPIQARLDAAQIEVDKASEVVAQRQLELTAAEGMVTAAEKIVAGYQAAADLAKAKLELEGKSATALDEQRQLLGQIAAAQQANADALADYQQALKDYNASAGGAGKGIRPLGLEAGGLEAPTPDFAAGVAAGEAFFAKVGEWVRGGIVAFTALKAAWDVVWLSITSGGNMNLESVAEGWGKAIWDGLVKFITGGGMEPVGGMVAGAIAGALIGGPPGAIIGAALGILFGSSPIGKAVLGGIGTAIKWAFDVLFSPGSEPAIALGANIQGIANGIGSFFAGVPGAIGDALKNVWNTITKPFSDAYDTLLGHSIIPDIVGGIIGLIGTLPGALLGLVNEAVLNVVGGFVEMAKGLPQPIRDALGLNGVIGQFEQMKRDMETKTTEGTGKVTSLFEIMKNEVGPKVKGLYDDATARFESLKTDAGQKVMDLWTNVTSRFQTGRDDTEARAREAKERVTAQMELMRSDGENKAALVTSGIVAKLGLLKGDAETKADDAKGGVMGKLEALRSEAETKSESTVKDSVTKLGTWATAVGPPLTAVATAFEAVFGIPGKGGGALRAIVMGGDRPGGDEQGGFLPWLEAVVRRVLDYQKTEVWLSSFNGLKDAVKTFVDEKMKVEWATKFEALGAAVAQGIAKGIADNAHLVTAATAKVVTDALAAGNAAAGDPHSPAPVFVPLGRTFVEGIAYGITSAILIVERAARSMVTAAVRAATLPNVGSIIDTLAARLPSMPTMPNIPNFTSISMPTTQPVPNLPGALAGAGAQSAQSQSILNAYQVIFNDNNSRYDPAVERLQSLLSGL